MVPSSLGASHGAGSEPTRSGLGLPGVGHHRGHVQQLGHAVIDPGFGDDHPAVGVATKHDRPAGLGDRLPARVDIVVEIVERLTGFAAARERHDSGSDSVLGERLGHFAPPPGRVPDDGAPDKDQVGMTHHIATLRGASLV
jgi:hypothetical protein